MNRITAPPKSRRFLVALAVTTVAAMAVAVGPGAADTGPFPENPLIPIGGGPFVFGSEDGESNEAPSRRIDLAPFAMTKYEISNRLYRVFAEAADCQLVFFIMCQLIISGQMHRCSLLDCYNKVDILNIHASITKTHNVYLETVLPPALVRLM